MNIKGGESLDEPHSPSTSYVAPFAERHTGRNVALGLDAIGEELGLNKEE